MKINYLDLFSGIGGFRLGLERAGFEFGWEGHSEIDKYAKEVYEHHFPNSEDLGDVKTVTTDGLPRIDLITFGFPCQDLSVAGKGAGLGGSRSGLFFEAMRIVRSSRPSYFIFENVKGLFSSNEGRGWLTVLREIADSGYDGQWQLLNTRDFGLPQNRERVYFIGYSRSGSRPQIFPIGESDKRDIEKIREGKFIRGGGKNTSGCLDTRAGTRYSRASLDNLLFLPDGVRCFTPYETERIQGFPDDWTFGTDMQRYKMCGNAVSVPVVQAVADKLIKSWEEG